MDTPVLMNEASSVSSGNSLFHFGGGGGGNSNSGSAGGFSHNSSSRSNCNGSHKSEFSRQHASQPPGIVFDAGQKQQNKAVSSSRLLFLFVLASAAAALSAIVYIVLRDEEIDDFEAKVCVSKNGRLYVSILETVLFLFFRFVCRPGFAPHTTDC